MLCPECHAEYLDHIKECGDCNVSLTDACPIDIPIPEMTWSSLTPFEGKVYADMAAELLDRHSIPYYLKMDWTCLLYTSPSPRDLSTSRMPSSA